MFNLRNVLLTLDCVLLAYFGLLLVKVLYGSADVIPAGVAFGSIVLHMVYLYRDKPQSGIVEERGWLSL